MDPADTYLGRLLMDEITPVVMVLSTPLAEEACRKSGLDVVRLLAPFCVFNNIDVPVRTATDQPYRLQTFRLRMVYASEIRPWDPEVANKHLEDVVNKSSENVRNDFQNDLPALQKMLTRNGILMQWQNLKLSHPGSIASIETSYEHCPFQTMKPLTILWHVS